MEKTKSYYIMFYNEDKKVCGKTQRATNEDEAILLAEFSIIAHYPNVKYTHCEVINSSL